MSNETVFEISNETGFCVMTQFRSSNGKIIRDFFEKLLKSKVVDFWIKT